MHPDEDSIIEELLNRVNIDKLSHSFIEIDDGKVKAKFALDKGYATLVAFNAHLRKNFYEFQTVRAAYFNIMARLMYQIYLIERVNTNKPALDALSSHPTDKEVVAAYYERHPDLINRSILLQRSKAIG